MSRWGKFFITLTLILAIFVMFNERFQKQVVVKTWPLIHDLVHGWSGPQEEILLKDGLRIILQYEDGDEEGAAIVKEVLASSVNAAEIWGEFQVPVTVRIYRDSVVLQMVPSDYIMAPAGRAFDDLVVIVSPTTQAKRFNKELTRVQLVALMTDTLTHELVHVNVFQQIGGLRAAIEVPTWFLEGLASATEDEDDRLTPDGDDVMRNAKFDPAKLVNDWYTFYGVDPHEAYRASTAMVHWMRREYGDVRVRDLMTRMGHGLTFEEALVATYGMRTDGFMRRWWLADVYGSELRGSLDLPVNAESVEKVCSKPEDGKSFSHCNQAFERLWSCPPELPGVCLSEYEWRMGHVIIEDGFRKDPWMIDCECLDRGPWPG